MLFKRLKIWFNQIFLTNKKIDARIERLTKETKVKTAELAVFKEAEAIRLKAKLAVI